jgi:hypothetical protein
MKVLLVILAIAATCTAENCDNTFGAYLNALKDDTTSDDTKAKALEEENRDDYRKLIRDCFAESTDDSSKCALTNDELEGDVYGDSGPLKGCSRCQTMVKGFRDKFMNSKEEVRKCFRSHFAQAVREELEPCIQGKISDGYNFKVPPVPDFDEKTFQNIEIAEAAVNYRIKARSRLDACQSVNPGKYANSGPCMNKGYAGIFAKHCQSAKNAKSKAVSSGCGARFGEVKGATCKCMDEKRDEWHVKFAKIQDIVNNAESASQCGKEISDVVGAWLSKLQSALSECMPKEGNSNQQRDLRTLIELGCGQVINGGVKKNELTVGFRFIRLFLDALNDRITIFCDKNCSF